MPPPQPAKPAGKSARCGVGDGSPFPHPPHPQPVGSRPRQHAPKDHRSGMGERPTPDAPHTGRRAPPRAPSCLPHNAQSQLARARAVGWVTSPCVHTPRTYSQWVLGPGRTLQRTSSWGWESSQPLDAPHTGKRHPPPGALVPPPQHAKAARKSARCGVPQGGHTTPSQAGGERDWAAPPPP